MVKLMIESTKQRLLIGVISDTHIPSRTDTIPQEIVDDFKGKKVDYVFHLGDYTTLEAYKQLTSTFGEDKVIGISGNMDSSDINKSLPSTRELEVFGHRIFLTHGSGGPNRIIKRLNKQYDLRSYDIIIFGHVHQPINQKENGKYYFNPGTPTDKRFTDVNSYGFLEISEDTVNFKIIRM
jgi:putative phosphoesterase